MLVARAPTIAFCATWWHQFHRFSVLNLVLVKRLWDPCRHGSLCLKQGSCSIDGRPPDSDGKPGLSGDPSSLCTGTPGIACGPLWVCVRHPSGPGVHAHPSLLPPVHRMEGGEVPDHSCPEEGKLSCRAYRVPRCQARPLTPPLS